MSETEQILCPACGGCGWITGTLNEKSRPCLDQECIDGKGYVPEGYEPAKPKYGQR